MTRIRHALLIGLMLVASGFVTGQAQTKIDLGSQTKGTLPVTALPNPLPLPGPVTASLIDTTVYVKPTTPGSTTSGIQEAINSFPKFSCGTVILPRGVLNISTMISVLNRYGCTVVGQGGGYNLADSATVLNWTGASGGTVFQVNSTLFSSFSNFEINGNGLAGIGLEITASIGPTTPISVDRIDVAGTIAGIGNEALHIGSVTNAEVDNVNLNHMSISVLANGTGLYQDGGNTSNCYLENSTIGGPYLYGANYQAGQAYENRVDFERTAGGGLGNTLADVNLGAYSTLGTAIFNNNTHEDYQGTGPAYLLPAGTRLFMTVITNTQILWENVGGNIILDQQGAPLILTGNEFLNSGSGTGGTVTISAPRGSAQPVIQETNNYFGKGNSLSVSGGSSSLITDGTYGLPGTANGATYYQYGTFYQGGSINFGRTTDIVPTYSWYDQDGYMALKSGATLLQYWDGSGNSSLTTKLTVPRLVGTVETGSSGNTDQAGILALSAATTASYLFTGTYAHQVVCGGSPSAANSGFWITYAGVASFTVNFSAAYTGNFNYICVPRT